MKLYWRQTVLPDDVLLARLSPERREKVLRCHDLETAAGLAAAGLLLAEYVADEGAVLRTPEGKPYLPGGPEFSLSHGGDLAVLLISDTPCGVDVECADRAVSERIRERAFQRIFQREEADSERAFSWLWTRKEAVMKLLNERDGLALGICNGFQALIKLGLVPYGEITGQKEDSPTLTFNTINRHISKMVYTKVVSNKSPWLQGATLGATYCNPASHGEGRFVAPKEWIDKLFANGQVATQYADQNGNVSMDEEYNVNGSYCAIEGITSPDGRCLGKMAHSERRDTAVAMNIYGEQDMKIFESGVQYFK